MDPKVEIIEEEQEHDIPVEDIVGAIDEELSAEPAAPEPEPEPEPEPKDEDEPKTDVPDAEVQVPDVDATAEGDEVRDDKPAEAEAKPADDDGEPKAEPEAEPEAKADDKAEEKPSDEFGALEEGTPERTRERFEAVKSKYDEIGRASCRERV